VQFLIDNIILIAVAFVSGAMLVWPAIRGRASGPTLSTLQATQLINSLNERLGELKKDKPVLLVCATGTSAGRIAALLRSRGFAEVFVLAGGIAGWREAGLPLRA